LGADGLSGSAPTTLDVAAVTKASTDKEAMDKRATEEATLKAATNKEVGEKRASKEDTVKAIVDKEAADKRAVEEATVKRDAEEATVKAAAGKEVTDKRIVDEATVNEVPVGAARDSLAPDQVPTSTAGVKRVAVPSGSTPPAKRPYMGI
jgi:hypothetical protein